MMPFEDIAFQLVDLPPLSERHVEPWVLDLVRRADLLWVVLEGLSALDGFEEVRRVLEKHRMGVYPGGGNPTDEDTSLWPLKKSMLVLTGADKAGVIEAVDALDELLERRWPLIAVSSTSGIGLEALKRKTFQAFDIIRVYTKQPGKPADRNVPFTLARGAHVADLAEKIHKDLLASMKFARVRGPSAFDGQAVQKDHVLAEGDVVEIHT